MMQINEFLLAVLRAWYQLENLGYQYWGFLAGVMLQLCWLSRRSQRLSYFCFVSAGIFIVIPALLFMYLPKMTVQLIGRPYWILRVHLYWLIGGIIGSLVASFFLSRYFGEYNHPSGSLAPSSADRKITDRLRDALSLFDIRVLDHLIVGGGSVSAFSKLGLL